MYTYLMLPAAVRAEVPALALERRERGERRPSRSARTDRRASGLHHTAIN
jgi:hypothetical protein